MSKLGNEIREVNNLVLIESKSSFLKQYLKIYEGLLNKILVDLMPVWDDILEEDDPIPILEKNASWLKIKKGLEYELKGLASKQQNDMTNAFSNLYVSMSQYLRNRIAEMTNEDYEEPDQEDYENKLDDVLEYDWCGDDKIYLDRINEQTGKNLEKIEKDILDCVIKGSSQQELTEKVASSVTFAMYCMERIFLTESNYILNSAALNTYIDLQIEKYEFEAELDDRTTPMCEELDATIMDVEDANYGENVPPLHAFCRSVITPYIDTDKDKELEGSEQEELEQYFSYFDDIEDIQGILDKLEDIEEEDLLGDYLYDWDFGHEALFELDWSVFF